MKHLGNITMLTYKRCPYSKLRVEYTFFKNGKKYEISVNHYGVSTVGYTKLLGHDVVRTDYGTYGTSEELTFSENWRYIQDKKAFAVLRDEHANILTEGEKEDILGYATENFDLHYTNFNTIQ